jgi:hypothetical protein
MKPLLVFDTAALISLVHTELIDLILDNYSIIISNRIYEELSDIAVYADKDGDAARKWLERMDLMEIRKARKEKTGEIELLEICSRDKLTMVTDDVRATKAFDNNIEWIFSVHIIFLLYHKGIISQQRGFYSIEKMRNERGWKYNIIYVTGRMLFQK